MSPRLHAYRDYSERGIVKKGLLVGRGCAHYTSQLLQLELCHYSNCFNGKKPERGPFQFLRQLLVKSAIHLISFDRSEGVRKKNDNNTIAPLFTQLLMETNYVTVGYRREERDGRLKTQGISALFIPFSLSWHCVLPCLSV